ncbi:MAG: signal peptidase I [Microbacterium sp.]|uniref:signal peptidase I n=1 Tax=Microbacterium sp. TaxID=51671 RepID=UPI0039E2E763
MLRRIARGTPWLLAFVGVACAAVWGLTAAGLIKPLIVISGSMEPEIMTGVLLVDTRVPASELREGDVVSLPRELASNLVTHRIKSITAAGDGGRTVTMKGDANAYEDNLDDAVAGDVWMPRLRLPGVGTAIARMTTPAVAVPLLAGLVGLIGVVWMVPAPVRPRAVARPAPAAMGTAAGARLARCEHRARPVGAT